MVILDIHHHLGPRSRHSGSDEPYDVTRAVDRHLWIMDRHGVDACCLLPAHNAAIRSIDDVRRTNDWVAEARDREPTRFVAGVGSVDPSFGDLGLAEIERCQRELGFKAMAWHPRYQGTAIDSPSMMQMARHAADLGMPVLMHMIAESQLEAPWRMAAMAEAIPHGCFVALDAFSSHSQMQWVTEIGGALTNVSFELSLMLSSALSILDFVRRWGPERLIFGSDFYDTMERRLPIALLEVRDSDLPAEQQEQILAGNATALLALD